MHGVLQVLFFEFEILRIGRGFRFEFEIFRWAGISVFEFEILRMSLKSLSSNYSKERFLKFEN